MIHLNLHAGYNSAMYTEIYFKSLTYIHSATLLTDAQMHGVTG